MIIVFSTYCDLRSRLNSMLCKFYLPDWIQTLSQFSHQRSGPTVLWILKLKTLKGSRVSRWFEVPITFAERFVTEYCGGQQWTCALEILLPQCTSPFACNAVICWLKSLHANLYMQKSVHDSPSYAPSLCSQEERENKKTH